MMRSPSFSLSSSSIRITILPALISAMISWVVLSAMGYSINMLGGLSLPARLYIAYCALDGGAGPHFNRSGITEKRFSRTVSRHRKPDWASFSRVRLDAFCS